MEGSRGTAISWKVSSRLWAVNEDCIKSGQWQNLKGETKGLDVCLEHFILGISGDPRSQTSPSHMYLRPIRLFLLDFPSIIYGRG